MERNLHLTNAPDSAVVIPAYQPADTLVSLTRTLTGSGYCVIVVDDGSGSEYEPIWRRLGPEVYLLHHRSNLGKGAALKTAFSFIASQMPNVGCIITMDADGQHLPQDMEQVALRAWRRPGTLVLGARCFDNAEVPLRSRLGNQITRFVCSAVAGTKVHDTQTGLRAFNRSLLAEMLNVSGTRYEYEMNALLHCKAHGIPIEEVPIQTVYLDKANSCSHFDTLRDSLRIYKNIFRFAASSLVSFLADYLMFLLLTAIFPAGTLFLVLSNLLARLASASLNYTLNAKAVFRGNRSTAQTLPQYALLAAAIFLANSLILTALVSVAGVPEGIAKLLTELLLFLLSYTVQARLIFRPDAGREGGARHAFPTKQRSEIA